LNHQVLIDGVKNATGSMPPPVVKNMDIMQTQHASGFPGTTLNTYQEPITILHSIFGELNSEKKPADVLSISQKFPGKANEGSSSSGSFSKKNRWDDDDDDMPEWCPPDMEYLDAPKPSTGPTVLPPVPRPSSDGAKELPVTTPPLPVNLSCPPSQSPSFSQGYHPGTLAPRSANPAPVHNNGSFVPIDFRPPQVPHPNHSMRSSAPNFGPKPSVSDVSWQWKR